MTRAPVLAPHRRRAVVTFTDRYGRSFDARGWVIFREGKPCRVEELQVAPSWSATWWVTPSTYHLEPERARVERLLVEEVG